MGVGMTLKRILRDKKMSIKQLSQSSGISVNTLYSITKRDSERVDSIILEQIAAALGVSVLDLLGANTPEDRRLLEQDAQRTRKSMTEVELDAAKEILDERATLQLLAALESADQAVSQAFLDIPDRDIEVHLNSIIADELTRDGKILTLKRAYELSLKPGYGRFAAKLTQQLTLGSTEGQSTTPPPDAPETPPEGK